MQFLGRAGEAAPLDNAGEDLHLLETVHMARHAVLYE
jgi:hypothetical protein